MGLEEFNFFKEFQKFVGYLLGFRSFRACGLWHGVDIIQDGKGR